MTFLFTDIEGSTRLWERYPDLAPDLIEHHDRLVEAAVHRHGGTIFHRAGDGMIARFDDATAATLAAVDSQRALREADWSDGVPVRVRMGVHSGRVVVRAEGPYGWALNYGTRLTDVGHGGQILLSRSAVDGLEPSQVGGAVRDLGEHRLRDIAKPARVFDLVVPDLPADFPSLRRHGAARTTLPKQRSPLIGRGHDVAAVGDAVRVGGCTTVTGPSGVGKTRVAIEVAARIADAGGADSVLWCDLSGVGSDALGASVMTAHAVAQRPGMSPIESLVEWLAGESVLLVLDRCDECLAGAAGLVDAVIEGASSVQILCTSQRPVGVRGEVVHRLAPLTIDDAVALFRDRARAAGATTGADEVGGVDGADGIDPSVVAEVCDRLERMPFAIEIVAASVAASTLDELLESLAAGGLVAVAGDSEAARSVGRAILVGIDALAPAHRERFLAATVFPGSFDRAMFGAVCAPEADDASLTGTLVDLVEASLVQHEPTTDRAMFRILDPVKMFAAAVADGPTSPVASGRLREYALGFSADVAAGLRGPEELKWLLAFERNFDTLRFVFDRALADGDVEAAARLATDNWEWAFFRYNSEYFDWGRRVLESATDEHDACLTLVHGVVALGHWFRDEFDSTVEHANEALRLEREQGGEFSLPARLAAINATVFAGANAPPADVFEEAAEYQRSRPERFYQVNVEAQNAMMATWLGQHDVAERRALRCLKTARASGNPSSIAYALWVLGQAIEHDDAERAEHFLDDALRQARDIDNRWIVSLTQTGLASIRRRTTGPDAAAPLLLGLLEQLSRAGHWAQFWNAVQLSALVIADLGDTVRAYQLASAVDAATMTFPSLPLDAAALEVVRSSIVEARGRDWGRRTARIAATWDLAMVADVARTGLEAVFEPA